jgi:hypothetical protein
MNRKESFKEENMQTTHLVNYGTKDEMGKKLSAQPTIHPNRV